MDSAWCWSSQHGVGDIYLPLLTYTGTSTSNIRSLCYVRHACYAKHPLGAVMVSESIFRSMSFFQSLTNMVMEEIKKYSCFNLELWSFKTWAQVVTVIRSLPEPPSCFTSLQKQVPLCHVSLSRCSFSSSLIVHTEFDLHILLQISEKKRPVIQRNNYRRVPSSR